LTEHRSVAARLLATSLNAAGPCHLMCDMLLKSTGTFSPDAAAWPGENWKQVGMGGGELQRHGARHIARRLVHDGETLVDLPVKLTGAGN
jgi:hypothetical protein